MDITSEQILIVGGAATALGVLIYQSPARAWRLLAKSYETRLTNLEDQMKDALRRIEKKDEEIEQRDGEIRRLCTIRSVLENLLRIAGVEIPRFAPGQHPEFAPERRDPPAAPVPIVVLQSEIPTEPDTPKEPS